MWYEGSHMLTRCLGIGLFLFGFGLASLAEAAPPNPKANPNQNLPSVDGDNLPPGQFAGTIVSVPDSDRMFTLKITYPEVRLKPGAKMPNFRSMEAKAMNQMLQQLNRAQRMPANRGGGSHRYNAMSNMMRQQQQYMQGQQRMAQAMARAEQKELQL